MQDKSLSGGIFVFCTIGRERVLVAWRRLNSYFFVTASRLRTSARAVQNAHAALWFNNISFFSSFPGTASFPRSGSRKHLINLESFPTAMVRLHLFDVLILQPVFTRETNRNRYAQRWIIYSKKPKNSGKKQYIQRRWQGTLFGNARRISRLLGSGLAIVRVRRGGEGGRRNGSDPRCFS